MPDETSPSEQLASMLERLRDNWPSMDDDNFDNFIDDPDDEDKRNAAIDEVQPLKDDLEAAVSRIIEIEAFIQKHFPEE